MIPCRRCKAESIYPKSDHCLNCGVPLHSVTTELPPLDYPIPKSLDEILNQGGSRVGNSAVMGWLSCPEASRLKALGCRRKVHEADGPVDLDALGYGSLIHALLAVRVVHGTQIAINLLRPFTPDDWRGFIANNWRPVLALSADDRLRAFHVVRTYDYNFPLEQEPWEYLGIESEVSTEIGTGPHGLVLRTARYDAIVRHKSDGAIFSLEKKTSSGGGEGAINVYTPQFSVQTALWNHNPALVEKYGRMVGVIPDVIIKGAVPKCERHFPRYITALQERRAIEYMMLPEKINFQIAEDGSYPRFHHSCWGRFRPCEYINLCWHGATGDYETRS